MTVMSFFTGSLDLFLLIGKTNSTLQADISTGTRQVQTNIKTLSE